MRAAGNGVALFGALSRLSPPIFSHPLWVDFQESGAPGSAQLVNKLLPWAEQMSAINDPGSAGQVLIACAVLLKQAGDYPAALEMLHQVPDLASQAEAIQTAIWVAWGCSSICLHQGHHQQAIEHLNGLQTSLHQAGDWVLADIVEVTLNVLPGVDPRAARRDVVVDWLLRWGESPLSMQRSFLANEGGLAWEDPSQPAPSEPGGFHLNLPAFDLPGLGLALRNFALRSLHAKPGKILNPSAAAGQTGSGQARLTAPRTASQTPHLLPAGELSSSALALPASAARPPSLSPPTRPTATARRSQISFPDSPQASLVIYCLGKFRVYQNERLTENWASRRGLAVFKYLVAHHRSAVPKEVLMDTFWQNASPESARNSLNVALYSLRRSLHALGDQLIVIFRDDAYRLNPNIRLWLDMDEFELHVQTARRAEMTGRLESAIPEYETCASLYQGDFLEEDLYEEWALLDRERLRSAYLECLERLSQIYFEAGHYTACISLCQRILAKDACSENAHFLLMRCFSRQGQYYLALRQYQTCVEMLKAGLDLDPSPATLELYERIRQHQTV